MILQQSSALETLNRMKIKKRFETLRPSLYLVTDRTSKAPLLKMHRTMMAIKIRPLGESSSTRITLIRFFTGMNSHVRLKTI